LFVAGVGRADKAIVADIQTFGEGAKAGAHLIGQSFGLETEFGGFFGDLTTVLITAGTKDDVVTVLSSLAG